MTEKDRREKRENWHCALGIWHWGKRDSETILNTEILKQVQDDIIQDMGQDDIIQHRVQNDEKK